ncbi:MAG: hypothetical protein P4M07_12445 [Xanthobacteraceae bacterium]|nr:hypothetical protein [Xanthobacteraceae bacterium]
MTPAPLARAAVIAAALAFAAPAAAGFLTGAQWLKLSAEEQAAYVAGVYDALVTYSTTTVEAEASAHYQTCAARARLTPESMAAGLKGDLGDDAKLLAEPAPGAFLNYIIKLCGKPQVR